MNTPELIKLWYEGSQGDAFSVRVGTLLLKDTGIYYKATHRAYTLTSMDLTEEWEIVEGGIN